MLGPQDDLLGHQLPTTFDHVGTSDPAWMERLWYTAHPAGGDVIIDIGLGCHPNRNVMDVFAGVTIGTTQFNFRASRRLRPNALETCVGPLTIQVVEGLRRHRLTLAPNDSGISFDLTFLATLHPHEEEPHFRRRGGRVSEDMARAQQFGRFHGWIEVAGRRFDLDGEPWLGQRDHSWGIRSEMRTDESHPPLTFYPPFLFVWLAVQFPGRGLHVFFKERAPGETIYLSGEETLPFDKRPDPCRRLRAVTHDVEWADDPLGQTVRAASFGLNFADGTQRTLQVRTLAARYFLKGGLYGGLNGWFHGDDKGKLHLEHDCWDLSNPEHRRLARTLSDQVVEVRDGDEVGHGIIEYGVSTGYSRYAEAQKHPPI